MSPSAGKLMLVQVVCLCARLSLQLCVGNESLLSYWHMIYMHTIKILTEKLECSVIDLRLTIP